MENKPELNISPVKEYEKRSVKYGSEAKRLAKSVNFLSNLRLITFVGGFGLSFYLYMDKLNSFGSAVLAITVISFIYLVAKHDQKKRRWKYSEALENINRNSLKRLSGEWKEFRDKGEDFIDDHHPYSGDLDIFGQGSLFQWLSVTNTYLGRIRLRELLTLPVVDSSEIRARQEGIKELAANLDWRQRLQAEGIAQNEKSKDPEYLFKWGRARSNFYHGKGVVLFHLLPILCIVLLLIAWLSPKFTYTWGLLVLTIQFLLLIFYKAKERGEALSTVSKYKEDIKTYYRMLKELESYKFNTDFLRNLQQGLLGKTKISAYKQIERLEKLADWIDNRNNAIFFPINILFLADYQFMIALESWKRESGGSLEKWLKTVAEFEALSSFAIIPYDNPNWAWPKLVDNGPVVQALKLGHPLISNRVSNDFIIERPTKVLLITGSNMSGKSTYLRTTGINLVLAYAGAPICAQEFTCSLMRIYTCMRVSDNLENNISSFYAELLRIKDIVEASQTQSRVFFLLDEIFKGTNSIDRHAGADILINKFIKAGAIGLVSTHDLELAELEHLSKGVIKNYHFREYYTNDEIKFDYKIRQGVSTTRNARYLMKMVGIH